MSMKNSNDTIGDRTRDPPTCSAVPQPTVPPRAPTLLKYAMTFSSSPGPPKKFLPFNFLNRSVDYIRKLSHFPTALIILTTSSEECELQSSLCSSLLLILLGTPFSRPPGDGPTCFHILETASMNKPRRRIC
jgi:hypothetical protein